MYVSNSEVPKTYIYTQIHIRLQNISTENIENRNESKAKKTRNNGRGLESRIMEYRKSITLYTIKVTSLLVDDVTLAVYKVMSFNIISPRPNEDTRPDFRNVGS